MKGDGGAGSGLDPVRCSTAEGAVDLGLLASLFDPRDVRGVARAELRGRLAGPAIQGRRGPEATTPTIGPGVRVELSAEAAGLVAANGGAAADAENGANRVGDAAGASDRNGASEGRRRPGELTPDEEQEVRDLKRRDAEVRAHEMAHKAAAGQHARGGPTYEFERGPDGRRYAVGGEVQIDTAAVPNDHDATIRKMQQVRRAALAPAEPSPQDRRVAAEASQTETRARAEKLAEQRAERSQTPALAYGVAAEPPRGELFDLRA